MHDNGPWHVYIVRCSDGTLYTGIARHLEKRIDAHNNGATAAKYTRGRRPVELVYAEPADSRAAASRREHQLKRMPRAKKVKLIDANPARLP